MQVPSQGNLFHYKAQERTRAQARAVQLVERQRQEILSSAAASAEMMTKSESFARHSSRTLTMTIASLLSEGNARSLLVASLSLPKPGEVLCGRR
jgi:hypothetical protein